MGLKQTMFGEGGLHFGWLSANGFIVFALVFCRRRPRKSDLGPCPNRLRYRTRPRGTSRPYSVTNRTTAFSTLKWDPPGANTAIPPLQVRDRRSSTKRARVAARPVRFHFVLQGTSDGVPRGTSTGCSYRK